MQRLSSSTFFQSIKANSTTQIKREENLPHDLLVDQLLKLLLSEIVLVLVEVEELLRNGCSGRLIFGIVVRLKVWVLECLVDSDALDGIECEQLLQEVESHVGGLGEHALEWDLLLEGERADVFTSAARLDAIVILHCRSAENVQDQGELVVVVFSGEEGLAAQHFSQNAANGPNVNGLSVLLERQHDFRCAVPAGSDVFSHEAGVVFLGSSRASKTEVTDLQVAIGVKEKVGWLEITVEDVGGVHGLESTEGLVYKVLTVVVREVLGADDSVHVCLHQLLNEINLRKRLIAARLLDIKDGDYVLMVEVSQQLHLTQSAQAEHGMIEGSNLLNSNLLARRLVQGRTDNTVCTLADDILNIILL